MCQPVICVQILLIRERDDDHSDPSTKSVCQEMMLGHTSGPGELKVFWKGSEDSLARCDVWKPSL